MANPNASLPRQCSLSSLQIKGSEAQRIADDRHGRQAHRQRRDHRTQQQASHRIKHPRRNGYAQRVITKGEEQVLPNIARHATRESTLSDEAHEVPLHHCPALPFHRDVRSCSHCYPVFCPVVCFFLIYTFSCLVFLFFSLLNSFYLF